MSGKLQTTSFNARPAALPRLSPERVYGRQAERFWKEEEDELLRANYVAKGPDWIATRLPHRTITAIYGRAAKLGLRTIHPHGRRERSDDLDKKIIAAWPALSARGDLQRFADEIGQPRWWITKCAVRLGLTKVRRKEPDWSEAEIALLRQAPLHDPDRAAEMFKARGFSRTASAIVSCANRMKISRRFNEALSAGRAANILGVDSKWITARCFSGALKARRRGSRRLPQQGGDSWAILPADLRRFVLDHLETIDIRKVEKFGFVALLTQEGA
jgi:DNA-directed RNA polymerase specialized sigma24 family protein